MKGLLQNLKREPFLQLHSRCTKDSVTRRDSFPSEAMESSD